MDMSFNWKSYNYILNVWVIASVTVQKWLGAMWWLCGNYYSINTSEYLCTLFQWQNELCQLIVGSIAGLFIEEKKNKDRTENWTKITKLMKGWGADGEMGKEAAEGKQENKKLADRLGKTRGDRAGLMRLMQGRCGGKVWRENQAGEENGNTGGKTYQQTTKTQKTQ